MPLTKKEMSLKETETDLSIPAPAPLQKTAAKRRAPAKAKAAAAASSVEIKIDQGFLIFAGAAVLLGFSLGWTVKKVLTKASVPKECLDAAQTFA